MSVSGKLVLAIKMFLESGQYKAELAAATKETEAAAARIEAAHTTTAKAATDAADKQIAALKKQIDTFGLSAAELRRYQASMVDASESQRAEINKLLENLEALEAKSASNASGTARMAAQWSAAGAGAKVAAAGTAFLVVAAAAVGLAYLQAGQETLAFEKAIILTGNRAGVTSGQLAVMARNIDGIAGTQANASAALAAITASGQVTRDNLQKVGLAAVEMERATGQSIGDTAKIFESLGDAPVKASLRLNESMNYLTAGTYEQIKAAEELGDKETAASIAQNAAADALRDRAARVEQHLGTLERAWRGVRDLAKEAWDAMLNVGREQTTGEKLEKTRKEIADLENRIASRGSASGVGGFAGVKFQDAEAARELALDKARLHSLQVRAAELAGVANQESESANAERERAEAVKASIALSDEAGKRDSALEKTRKAVAQATQQYTTAIKNEGLTQQERAQIDANYLKVVSDLTKVKEKNAGANKAAISDLEKLTKAGTTLTASLLAMDSGLSGDFAKKWESLNAAYRAGETSVEELTAAQAKLLSQQPLMKQAADEEAKATKELAKEREKALATLGKDLEKTLAAVAAQDEQNARLGLSKEAIAELDAAKLEMLATDLELQASNALFLNQDGALYEALMKQANAWRDLARAKREGGAKQAGIDAAKEAEKEAKKASDEWERAGERINSSLTDSLMRGFEAGKDAAENLRDTVVNMFKTMVLRPVISAVMSPISGAINGAVSGAAGSAGSSMLSSMGGSVIGNALGGVGAFGIGASYGATSLFANGLGATLSAGGQMIGAGSVMSGIGTIAGALGPIALGIGAIYSIAKSFDDSGTYHTGGAAQYSAATGLRTSLGFRDNEEGLPSYNPNDNIDNQFGTGFGYVERGDQTISAVSGIAQALGTALDGVAVAFGQKAGYAVATAFADDSSRDGAWGALRISKDGQDLLNWQDTRKSRWAPKEFGDGEGGYKEYLAAVAKDTRQVLLDMNLPGWADTVLNAIGDSPSIDSLSAALTQIGQAQTVFKSFGQYMTTFATLADSSVTKLAAASGGIDALAGNMGVFVDQFYTDAEKLAVNTQNVKDALAQLGFEMPATRDEFKALVQSQIALGDGGAKTTAGLLALSGAVSAVLPPFEDAAAGVGEVMRRLQSDTADLEIELLRAQGNITGADAAQRAIDTAGFTEAEVALYDYNTALRAQIGAIKEAAENMRRLQSDTADLEIELLRAQGNTTGADAAQRTLDTAGLTAAEIAVYDYNQALRAQIDALGQASAAAEAAAETARTAMQGQIDAFLAPIGDLASAMDEINPPAKTLVDVFRSTRDELTNLTNGLAQALGNLPEPTTLEQLRASMEALRGIAQASSDLNEQIFGIKVGRGDQSAVELLKSREASLFADLQTSADPAGAANMLAKIVLQRIAIEGKLEEQATNSRYKNEFDAAQAVADLESKNRRAQMEALRDQISGAGRLSEIAKSMQGFIAELKFGDLSALNPVDQLAAARGEYQRVLSAARGGDVTAAEQLQGVSAAFLREQQGYSGGATSGYASTFAQVMADLDAFGGMPVSDIELMRDQLESLDALEQAGATLQAAVIDTSQRQIDALGAINVALLSRTDDTKARADEQKAILEKQVEALSTLVEDQKAQIAQAAATHKAMMDRLEAMANNIDRITANSNQQAAQPA